MKMTSEGAKAWKNDPSTPDHIMRNTLAHGVADWPLPRSLRDELQTVTPGTNASEARIAEVRQALEAHFAAIRD